MNKPKIRKMNQGITLIALIITIIVLLILAGISITALTGENGILNQANTAKQKTEKETAEEQVKLAVMASYDKNGKLEIDELKTQLQNIQGEVTITDTNGAFPVTVIVDGYTFEIDDKGNVILKSENEGGETLTGITAKDIANSEDKSQYYGTSVTGYECQNNAGVNEWKIFYADENNIYLITDDYIHYDYCPPSATQTIYKNSDYKLSFNDVIKDYPNGSAHITSEKIKALNNDYFNVKSYASTNDNMKAVAYLLDTNVWSGFKGNKAEYAIGGPTVEMLMKSYSQKYNVNYKAQASNDVGYQISKDGGLNWLYGSRDMLNKMDRLYVNYNTEKADSIWIASPSANGLTALMELTSSGILQSHYYDYGYTGIRPLVCLNSDVRLEENSDGTYKLK